MTKLNEEQIAAGAAAIRAAEPKDSPEDIAQAVFAAVNDAKTGGSHEKRLKDLDDDIKAENRAALARQSLAEKTADDQQKADAAKTADAPEAPAKKAKH